jgi:HD-GYP domain-containing protein (c-di-GMP phosphodiesterase class II)
MAEADAFLPEQQTFFWEAANLLCQAVPAAAVALWLDDNLGPRPLMVYSRFPLSNDLKHQVVAQTLSQLPRVKRDDLKLLTRAEWYDRDPVAGHFTTVLPVLLEEEAGGDNLLMILRLQDRPFTAQEQDYVRQVARMLGFYLQEVSLHERYHQAFLSVSHRILASAEGRLPAMKTHSVNTAERCRELARKLDLPTTEVEAVSISAILHDVGTLLLDYRILDKPRLTQDELAKVRTHPLLASTFLKDLLFPFDVLKIIRHHHENWDGTGYPEGLKGPDIPVGSRIIRLVEAFEMMLSETPYRPAKTLPEAITEIQRLAGSHFDPELVAPFLEILRTTP